MGESLGARIRRARKTYGMTQAELARRVGVSKQTMYALEAGRVQHPSAVHIAAIAQVLRVSADTLLDVHLSP